ncbi:MAG: hypothetical protein K5686_10740 [Lachnospiraceae bacterium]|nr:hypothetical protein [Lachnospiraceae bacterium]
MELKLPAATEKQLREFVSVMQQARLILKDPERKYTDQFKGFRKVVIMGIVLIIIQIIMMSTGRMTGFLQFLMGCTLIMTGLAILSLIAMNKNLKNLINTSGPTSLNLSPVEIEHVSSQGDKITIPWANVKFIRIFDEMMTFFPYNPHGVLFAISTEYAPVVLDYMQNNNINIHLIAGEKK